MFTTRAMSGAVLHQGAAQVAIGQAPGLAQIGDPVVDIDFRLCEVSRAAPEPQHCRRPGPYLHQANLADASDNRGVVVAFDVHDRVGYIRRKSGFFNFLLDQGAHRCPERGPRLVGGFFHRSFPCIQVCLFHRVRLGRSCWHRNGHSGEQSAGAAQPLNG